MIKPDGVERGLIGEIIKRFETHKLRIVAMKMLRPERGLVEKHYEMHKGKDFYELLVDYISNKPVVAMVLEGNDAVTKIREIVGATDPAEARKGTIRGDLGIDSMEKATKEGRAINNLVHASGSKEEAEFEIGLWFKAEEIVR